MRFNDLKANDPCPPYQAYGGETYLLLLPQPGSTVGLCRRIIVLFELCIEHWGARVMSFKFGAGLDIGKYGGTFQIGIGRPPIAAEVDSTS